MEAEFSLIDVFSDRPFGGNLWGSEIRFEVVTCVQSGSDVVLVGESAENLLLVDPVFGEVDRFGPLRIGLVRPKLRPPGHAKSGLSWAFGGCWRLMF